MIKPKLHRRFILWVVDSWLINYPLNLIGLWICIDLLEWTDSFTIGTTITAWMTGVAYTRVYIIRRHFYNRGGA